MPCATRSSSDAAASPFFGAYSTGQFRGSGHGVCMCTKVSRRRGSYLWKFRLFGTELHLLVPRMQHFWETNKSSVVQHDMVMVPIGREAPEEKGTCRSPDAFRNHESVQKVGESHSR